MTIDTNALCEKLAEIRHRAEDLERKYAAELSQVHPNFIDSARNLLHYIALRQFDIREFQDQLSTLGLSSLGRAEQRVLPAIRAVERALRDIPTAERATTAAERELQEAGELVAAHKMDLLGRPPKKRGVSIMVTLPTEAASDYELVRDLVSTGMNIARINCAHDRRDDWQRMIDNIRRAEEELATSCPVVMDLAGPKIRTGALERGPKVLRLRPRRDALGRVIAPKRVRCVAENSRHYHKKANVLPIPQECVDFAEIGDALRFRDTRGRKRKMSVTDKDKKGLVLALYKTAYIATGTKLHLIRQESGDELTYRVGNMPTVDQPIVLHVGDALLLDSNKMPGAPATTKEDGTIIDAAHVRCIPSDIINDINVGDPVLLNDGKIAGRVESATSDGLVVRITRARTTGSRLRANRSINFPQSELQGSILTQTDRWHLEFVMQCADAVGMSFVREPADVIALQEAMGQYTAKHVGTILKIETKRAFKNLPHILLAAMRHYPTGIMIARGDLAVECGFVRLAVIQEEILWLCEAARMPVIWATQVLEDEAKKGLPTRAEITDAAMAQRADCVMLNKGPFILAAIRTLDDILCRMQHHQRKKKARLPRLEISEI